MSLSPGQTLASYEILEPLGSGGMGEVYLARDAKLGRDVAIKVLPEELAEDEERLLRFEREAKVLASLADSNIGAIYGFEREGDTRFLVLEYVEGESLAQLLEKGNLSMERALETCCQIACALEAAHEKGIVHRDLKPANVQITRDGTVKVLDFGLARAMGGESGPAVQPESRTITADYTNPGVVLGTAPYMSPEQARGQPVDKRTDIWAFGCCLFESLTGSLAFKGETVTDLFANIIKGEPDWKSLPKETPWKVRELLERCLAKDPSSRMRDIGDARIELRRLITDSGSLASAAYLTAPPARRSLLPLAGLGLAGLVLGVALTLFLTRPTPRPWRELAVSLAETLPDADVYSPLLLPDGSALIFQVRDDLPFLGEQAWFIHRFSDRDTRQLSVSDEPSVSSEAFLSHDGSRLGVLVTGLRGSRGRPGLSAELREVPLAGGPSRTLIPVGSPSSGAAWDADGRIILSTRSPRGTRGRGGQRGLSGQRGRGGPGPSAIGASMLFSWAPGQIQPELLYEEEGSVSNLRDLAVLPGGRAVLLTIQDPTQNNTAIGAFRFEDKTLTRLLEDAGDPTYVKTGHLLFVQRGSIMAARFDLDTLAVSNEHFQLVDGVEVDLGGNALYSVAREEGTLVYLPGEQVSEPGETGPRLWQIKRLGEDVGLRTVASDLGPDFAVSGDARWLIASTSVDRAGREGTRTTATEVLIHDLGNPNAPERRLTTGSVDSRLLLSPDGTHLAFGSAQDGALKVYVVPIEGRHPDPEPVFEGEGDPRPISWMPDSKTLLLERRTEGSRDVWELDLDGGGVTPALTSSFIRRDVRVSPDGSWIAFVSNLDGQSPSANWDLYVQRYRSEGEPQRITRQGASDPLWDPRDDALRLLYFHRARPRAASELRRIDFNAAQGELAWETETLMQGVPTRFQVDGQGRVYLLERSVAETSGDSAPRSPQRSPTAGDQFIYATGLFERLEQLTGDR